MKKVFLFILLSILTGCASKVGNLFTQDVGKIDLEANAIRFTIKDDRKIDPKLENIEIPTISFPSDYSEFNKRFSDKELKEIFLSEVILSNKYDSSALIAVDVLKSSQFFKANFFTETETVVAQVRVMMELKDFSCAGTYEVRGEVTSLDASVSYINQTLKDALSRSFNISLRDCLKKK